jgi:hypothetical protein
MTGGNAGAVGREKEVTVMAAVNKWDVTSVLAFLFGAAVIIPAMISLLLTILAVFGVRF